MTSPAENLAYHVIEESLRERAGDAAFERGRVYFAEGRVSGLVTVDRGFKAWVEGSKHYTVTVRVENDDLCHECSCPVGAEGGFCKHLVAACLAWKAQQSAGHRDSSQVIQAWLHKQEPAWLADTLLEQAFKDKRLYHRLLLDATRGQSGKPSSELRRIIDEVTATPRFVDYDASHEFVDGIHDVLNALDDATANDPNEVIELCLHALQRVKQAVEYVDDSDGELRWVIERIEAIHCRACQAAKPDPAELGATLFNLELRSEYGEFENALEKYADILGEQGIDEYCRIARLEWAKGDDADQPPSNVHHDGDRADPLALRQIMASIARRRGSLDDMIEVRRADLSSGAAYYEMVEMLRDQERFDEALKWARKGAAEFKHEGLEVLLAQELHRTGKGDAAISVMFDDFTGNPDMQAYLRLKEHADQQGAWPLWRDKAVGHIRKVLNTGRSGAEWTVMKNRALLVDMLVHQGDIKSALFEARAGACNWDALSRLAESCATEQPKEAIAIYMDLVPRVLEHASNRTYRQARDLLLRVARLYARIDRKSEFETVLDQICVTYKRKRNFMALLDKTKWP